MAILKTEDNSVELDDGTAIIDAAETLGVSFGCRQGMCSTCKVKVLEGMENLEEKNQEEIDMGLADDERLCCQAKIKSGEVKIQF